MERGPKERAHEKNRPKRHEGNPEKDIDRAVEHIKKRTFEVLKEGPPPSIRLEFFRHDDKEKTPEGGDDSIVRLTPAGRAHARATGKNSGLNPEMAVIYGSPRVRSVETGYQRLFAEEPGTSAEMSLEEMIAKVNKKIKYGKKHVATSKLDFIDGSEAMKTEKKLHYFKKKDFIRFLYEDSDLLATKEKDEISTTYSRNAANTASIIKKYLHALPRWEQITKTSDKKAVYEQNGNQIQRLFGSHGSVLEPFLITLIELNGGKSAAREFIQNMPDGNGFDFSEGYSVIISRDNKGTPIIKVTYKNLKFEVTEILLDRIIAARK